MRPTTNTPFEQFAFVTVMLLTFGFPFLVLGLVFLSTVLTLGADDKAAFGIMFAIVMAMTVFGIPVFSIIAALKIESDHLKALAKAEAELSDIVVSDMKVLPANWKTTETVFIAESVVIANDYLKSFFWIFRKLVGGESISLSRLLSRARREATVRVLRKAKQSGTNVVWNIRYETSAVQSMYAKDATTMITGVEVLAYATAFNVTAG
ncbi:MAG: YbjQ family protein [Planctomycetaceae bacterium]|nr:YbjQ family protein [Planctomycetaceae bacterium]